MMNDGIIIVGVCPGLWSSLSLTANPQHRLISILSITIMEIEAAQFVWVFWPAVGATFII